MRNASGLFRFWPLLCFWSVLSISVGHTDSKPGAKTGPLMSGAGFEIERRVAGRDKTLLRIRDSKSGGWVDFELDARGPSRDVKVYDRAGALVEFMIERPGFMVAERRMEGGSVQTEVLEFTEDPLIRRTRSEVRNGRRQVTSREVFGLDALLEELPLDCSPNRPLEELDYRLLNMAEPIVNLFATVVSTDAGTDLSLVPGQNLQVRGCDRGDSAYPGNGTDAPGVESLLRDAEVAWDQGLRCISNLAAARLQDSEAAVRTRSEKWRSIAAVLLGNFAPGSPRPYSLVCTDGPGWLTRQFGLNPIYSAAPLSGAYALAMVPSHEPLLDQYDATRGAVPGIILDSRLFSGLNPQQRRSVLFHELLHHAPGMIHAADGSANDWVVEATQCCFGETARKDRAGDPILMSSLDRTGFAPRGESCDRMFAYDHGQHMR